jgi:hypothetical protein
MPHTQSEDGERKGNRLTAQCIQNPLDTAQLSAQVPPSVVKWKKLMLETACVRRVSDGPFLRHRAETYANEGPRKEDHAKYANCFHHAAVSLHSFGDSARNRTSMLGVDVEGLFIPSAKLLQYSLPLHPFCHSQNAYAIVVKMWSGSDSPNSFAHLQDSVPARPK